MAFSSGYDAFDLFGTYRPTESAGLAAGCCLNCARIFASFSGGHCECSKPDPEATSD